VWAADAATLYDRFHLDGVATCRADSPFLEQHSVATAPELAAVVLDWAGTTIDFGSRAPVLVVQEVFAREGIPVSSAEAREPMGRAKRDHLAAMLQQPRICSAWTERFGKAPLDADVERLYQTFLPLQKTILHAHSALIPGCLEAVAACRQRGLKIGTTTGYTRALMSVVVPEAARQQFLPDCTVCSDDVTAARPAPWMLVRAAEQLGVFPFWRVIKVDDTPAGIAEGLNAGAWTVGLTDSGNELGLPFAEYSQLSPRDLATHRARATAVFQTAGAHFVIPSIAELPAVLDEVSTRLARGERPV
jgi:phosphonoacetaldehyde hydrolase